MTQVYIFGANTPPLYSEVKVFEEMFQKTNFVFHRTLHKLKSFLFRVCKKLPRRPLSCTICRSNSLHTDNLYIGFLNTWESDLQIATDGSVLEHVEEDYEARKPRASSRSWRRERDRETFEEKMKELDMTDSGDIEHALDVEEALHYYSRLRSPQYLDIVDKFFADLYSDLPVPQSSSVGAKNSQPRIRSYESGL